MKKALALLLWMLLSGGALAQTSVINSYVATRFYAPMAGTLNSGNVPTVNKIYCQYAFFPENITFQTVGIKISTLSVGGNVQGAFYTDAGGKPGTLIQSSASISTTLTAGATASLVAPVQLGPTGSSGGPRVWMCSNNDNGVAAFISQAPSTPILGGWQTIGSTTVAGTITTTGIPTALSCSGANCQGGSSTFNTWPADLTTSTWTIETGTLAAFIIFQVSSVP